MRHLRKGRKLGRERKLRRALLKNMTADFFARGRIETTEAKAKELRPLVEQLLTRATKQTLANRRILASSLSPVAAAQAIRRAGAFTGRPGGYVRIVKRGARKSDNARMAILELVQ